MCTRVMYREGSVCTRVRYREGRGVYQGYV